MLEPYVMKVTSTVLRGGGSSNTSLLPGNIEQMKVLIAQLEELGQAEVSEQIETLKAKIAELEAKAFKEVKEVIQEVAEELPAGFWVKYRVELIVTAVLIASHIAEKFGD